MLLHPFVVQVSDALDLLAAAEHILEQLRIDVLFAHGRLLRNVDADVVVVVQLEVFGIQLEVPLCFQDRACPALKAFAPSIAKADCLSISYREVPLSRMARLVLKRGN